MIQVQFGSSLFEVKDAWPSSVETPVREISAGVDIGGVYLSFPLSDEQKKFLGGTTVTHLRLEVKEIRDLTKD